MTGQHEAPRDAVATAKDLAEALKATTAEVRRLRSYGRHNRAFIIVDIALTVLLSGVGYLSVHAIQSADQANAAQMALCQAGNTARAQQVQLWDHLLSIAPPKGSPPRTAAQKAQAAAFRAYVHHVFENRDCSQLGR